MGCCGSEPKKKIKYKCADNCCDKTVEVEECQPVPECCGKPMVKKDDSCSCCS